MAIEVTATEVKTQSVNGNLHATQISFVGDGLVNADGTCVVESKVFVSDGVTNYLIPAPDYLATTTVSVQEIYNRTYLNGTVTGAEILTALAEMCEYMWNKSITEHNQ